jgi:hypothetical protein
MYFAVLVLAHDMYLTALCQLSDNQATTKRLPFTLSISGSGHLNLSLEIVILSGDFRGFPSVIQTITGLFD